MQLFIPTLGTRLKLLEDWKFTLHDERRNSTLKNLIEYSRSKFEVEDSIFDVLKDDTKTKEDKIPCVLPAGTILTVRRIYIRQGAKAYDSVTFSIHKCPEKLKGRFWVKLHDANTMQCEEVIEAGVNFDVQIKFRKPWNFYFDAPNSDHNFFTSKVNQMIADKEPLFVENILVDGKKKYDAICYVKSIRNQHSSYYHGRWNCRIERCVFDIFDSETKELVGTWGTFDTIKKKIRERESKKTQLVTA